MKSLYDIVQELADTSSRKEKERILSEIKGTDNENLFKHMCRLTYDPSIDFFIKEFEAPDDYFESISFSAALNDLENILGKRVFTGNMARSWITMTMGSLSEEKADLFARVIKRDLRCGISTKTVNKIWPGLIYEHPYMRCSSFSEKNLKNISFPCYSQTKMDGLYCDIIVTTKKVVYRTRNESILPLNDEQRDKDLIKNFSNFVIQGEIVAKDEDGVIMDRASSNGYINSDHVELNRVFFYAWDMVPFPAFVVWKCNTRYENRLKDLQSRVLNLDWLRLVDTKECFNQDGIIDHFREMRKLGQEGTVIKDKSTVWKNGTSKTQVKCKVIFDCDMKLVGWKEGTGKNVGKIGALLFESTEGKVKVSVGTGYKDTERDAWLAEIETWCEEGRIGCVRGNDITREEDGTISIFLPRFVEWRNDKSEADTAERIQEQVKSFTNALDLIGK